MRLQIFPVLSLLAFFAACSEFPELDYVEESVAQNVDYPDLEPIESLQAEIPDTQIEAETQDDLESRVKRLKSRQKRLKGAVVDAETQERMNAGIQPVTE